MAETGGIAIVAGQGVLPRLVAERLRADGAAYRVVVLAGVGVDWAAGHPVIDAAFERLGALVSDLKAAGIGRIVFAGAMTRPALDPSRADRAFLAVAPRLMAALAQGDDATLRFVLSLFEDEGFGILEPQAVLPALLPGEGELATARPDPRDLQDIARARQIVAKLGEADVGQGAVVAGGICLGVETIGGTDRLLSGVAALPAPLRGRRGVLVKAPKPGQDRRVDLPAIGPETADAAVSAGLAGIAFPAGEVLVLDREEAVRRADAGGLFLHAYRP